MAHVEVIEAGLSRLVDRLFENGKGFIDMEWNQWKHPNTSDTYIIVGVRNETGRHWVIGASDSAVVEDVEVTVLASDGRFYDGYIFDRDYGRNVGLRLDAPYIELGQPYPPEWVED